VSERATREGNKVVAGILGYSDPRSVTWEKLQFEDLVAIRTSLREGSLACGDRRGDFRGQTWCGKGRMAARIVIQ